MELENSRTAASDLGEKDRQRRGEKKNGDAGQKTGKKPAKQGRIRRFLPRFSFSPSFFLPSLRDKRNVGGTSDKFIYMIFNSFRRKKNVFWSESEKDRATFFGSSKHCLYIRAVDVPSPHRFHKPKDGDDERPARLFLRTRQIGVRTPAGRPQDPMGWLELRPFF